MISYFIWGVTYAFSAVAQPGPFQTYLMSQSVARGWRRTLPAAFAPLFSDVVPILLVLIVLSRAPASFLHYLRYAGGAFVLYLAFRGLQTWRSFERQGGDVVLSQRTTLLEAVTVNLLNPNPYIAWNLVLGPLLLKGWHESPSHALALVIGFYVVMIVGSMAIIVFFASAGSLGPRVRRTLIALSAVALACFGAYLIWSGATESAPS